MKLFSQFYDKLEQKPILFSFLIFLLALLIYYLSNLSPLDWYKHYVYLSDSFLHGRFDVPQLPEFYQDVINFNGKKFLPFAPAPAIFLIPLVAIFGTHLSQVWVSMVVGAVNTVLVWLILKRFALKFAARLLLTIGFAFGTVHFYAAITGTTWFFAHIMATLFILLAILEFFGQRRPAILGFLVGFAFLSRQPTILSALFFVWPFLKEKHCGKILIFSSALLLPIIFFLFYNFFRFGNIAETGYGSVYNYYINFGIKYNLLRTLVPNSFPHFGQLDIRNIPLHFYTMFFMFPNFSTVAPFITPSIYGMGMLLTSPFLIYSIFARNKLVLITWVTIILVGLPDFLFYAQGWVQFGYRFALDFLPFLLILTALGFQKRTLRLQLVLVFF